MLSYWKEGHNVRAQRALPHVEAAGQTADVPTLDAHRRQHYGPRLARATALLATAFCFVFLLGSAPLPNANYVQVDPRVWEDTANGETAHFLVVLKSQADARRLASQAPDRAARGQMVFEGLRQAAATSQPAVAAELDALGARYRAYWIVNLFAVEGNRSVLNAMLARADVAAIESDRPFRVPLEQQMEAAPAAPTGVEPNIAMVSAPWLWAHGYAGQGQVYANADTGVLWEHPALLPHYRGWDGSTADHNHNWWDAIHTAVLPGTVNDCGYNLTAPCDDFGHGTHTMGTAIGDDGAGNRIGMAPGAKWIACRNMDGGVGRPSTYIECMNFFLAPTDLNGNNPDPSKRPDAVGNSYTCPPAELCDSSSLQAAMDNLRSDGVFMSVSAGNSGPFCSTISEPPAIYDSAITVGAVNSLDAIAAFSSRGPVNAVGYSGLKPDLVAPGVGIRSSTRYGGYGLLSGTSMAAPHVAGAVLLLWSAFPALARNVNQTELIMESSALHLPTTEACGGDTFGQIPNNTYGYGRLDVYAACNAVDGAICPPLRKDYFPFIPN